MIAHRAAAVLSGTFVCAFALAALATPGAAQIADDVAINILRECSRIDDPSARLACYDNNIRNVGGAARNTIPGQVQAQGGAAPAVVGNAGGVSGFGREDVRTPERFNSAPAGEAFSINARVSSVRQRQPGIYALTLEDGAEWIFSNSVSASYRPPQAGSVVEIRRGALGSFLMRFDNQESVRVRRQR
ncbi:hypothetical protein [Altererythrobacter lauratis]|uniref:Uncharacterized protein n=1 Tax=Alteraurantiacibacter lauratis TaxID=2054627 RepID=A0ABV7EA98_9SPHN